MRKGFPIATFLAVAAAAARLAWGQTTYNCTQNQPSATLSDGTFVCLAETAINPGGICMKDSAPAHADNCATTAGLMLTGELGKFSAAMTGGALQLWPGVVASLTVATTDTSASHAFPTPFIPSQGHTMITFSALPAQVTIQIYTLSGHLVKTLSKSDPSDRMDWKPVANEQGANLASGVYFFIVTQPGGTQKKGKLMIIR